MSYSNPSPRQTDSDNVLLKKICQVLANAFSGGSSGGASASLTIGASNINASQAATSTSASQVLAARLTRRSVSVKNLDSSITIYIGHDGTVSSTTGMELKAGESISIDSSAAIFAISASGTPRLAFLESFN